jgi:L-asparagine oxygenase
MAAQFGLDEFPLHTDRAHDRIPPRFLLLSQLETSAIALTRVLSLSSMGISKEELMTLRRDVWCVRYGRRPFLTPILNDTLIPDADILRWDLVCMSAERHMESREIMQERIHNASMSEFQLDPSHLLIIDNWRCLHGRSAILDPGGQRRLRRILVRHAA